MNLDEIGMMPEVAARVLLRALPIDFSVLTPPYPVAGVGALRVLRVRERAGRYELVAGYEAYEKLAS